MDLERALVRFRDRGDTRALAEVFDTTAADLFRVALHLCGNPADAEDLLQATFVAAIEGADRFDAARPLRPWLHGILANQARLQARARRPADPDRLRRPRPAPVPELAARHELAERVDAVLDTLDEPYREVLVLRLRYGLTPGEIADALRRAPGTVRVQLHRGLRMLRKALPAGLASAFLIGIAPTRGFAAMKKAVLARGAACQVPVTVAVATAGALAMKKKLVLAALVLAALGTGTAYLFFRDRGPQLPAREARTQTADPTADEAARAPGPPSPLVDLDAVERDRDLHGTVVRGTDGAPIAGAELCVLTYPWRRANVLHYDGYFDAREGPRARSGPDGAFVLRLRPGAGVSLRVRAAGYATLELASLQAGERVRVAMQAGVRLTVVTRDESGRPVPGTRLRLWREGTPTVHAVADDGGRVVFAPLPGPAVYELAAHSSRLGHPGWERVLLPAAGVHEHVVTLVEGRTLTGRVTDADTGEPVANARVGMNWVLDPSVLTGADGRYALPGWTGEGVREVHCVADGYGRAEWTVGGDRHDFALVRGDAVTGRLVGADGRPVAGAAVSSTGSARGLEGQQICSRAGRTDADGRFLLTGLRRDLPQTLVAMAEGHGRYLLDFGPHPDVPGTVDLGEVTLPAARTIAGRIASDAGEPVPRVEVGLVGFNADRGRLRGGAVDPNFSYGTTESRHTDDLGRFRFPDLAPGRYTLWVQRPGTAVRPRRVTLADTDRLDVEITLPEARPFTVTVVDEEGVAVPGVFVSVVTERGESGRNNRTDARGKATFFVAARVTKVLAHPFASGRDLLRATVAVDRGGDAFRVVLRRAATIAGTVLREDGEPLAQARVAAMRDGETVDTARTGSDGRFALDVPREDAFDIELFGVTEDGNFDRDAYAGKLAHVPSGATGVELRVRRVIVATDRTLRVKVVYPDGAPAAGVVVFAGAGRRANAGADGIAAFSGLPAKEIFVAAFQPDDRDDLVPPESVTLVPAGQEVTLRLRAALPISGIVLKPDGSPAAGAIVRILATNRTLSSARTDREGRFLASVAADEPGPLTVRAEGPDELTGEVSDVRAGATGLRIRLE